jgi:hypothetical protein
MEDGFSVLGPVLKKTLIPKQYETRRAGQLDCDLLRWALRLDDLSTACAAIAASWSVDPNTALVPLNLNLVGLLLAIYLDRLPTDDEVHWVRFEADLCLLAVVDGEHIMPQVVQALSTAKRHHARAAFGSLVRASF